MVPPTLDNGLTVWPPSCETGFTFQFAVPTQGLNGQQTQLISLLHILFTNAYFYSEQTRGPDIWMYLYISQVDQLFVRWYSTDGLADKWFIQRPVGRRTTICNLHHGELAAKKLQSLLLCAMFVELILNSLFFQYLIMRFRSFIDVLLRLKGFIISFYS